MSKTESKFGNVAQKTFRERFSPEVLKIFDQQFKVFTDVQVLAGTHLLNHCDVVAESPTGSGKTLSFLLPIFSLLQKTKLQKSDIGALILTPSRELSSQIASVARPYADQLGLTIQTVTGGDKLERSLKRIKEPGANILVATPGRLYKLLELEKAYLVKSFKNLQVFIVDEADRFSESQFEVHLKEIVNSLPKQRRTGLFSATQAKETDEMLVFGLRNAKKVVVSQTANSAAPSSLNNFYTVCAASEKTIRCLEFIRQRPDKKILVFFPSCSAVQFFHMVYQKCLSKRPIFMVHGKCSTSQRGDQLKKFTDSSNGVILSTDVMARGIDVSDIDWVVQYELPKLSSWFIHRAGRTARCGREGNALIIISTEQSAYVPFVSKYEKVELKELKVPTSNERKAEELRLKMIRIQCADREILETGTRAFVSHIEAYAKHDCNIVCELKDLDVVGLAKSYALLRLPRMRELTQRKDLEKFGRSDIDTSTIKYANPKLEASRDQYFTCVPLPPRRRRELFEVMREKHNRKIFVLGEKAKKGNGKMKRNGKTDGKTAVDRIKAPKRKAEGDDGEDIHSDIRLLKKIKRGKLSKKEIKDVLT